MEEKPNIAGGETGICRFCGQMVNVQWLRGFENHKDRDADYLASRFCGCLDSKKYAEAEQRREDAAALVYDGDANHITVDDSDGITAKIKLTSKGQLRITRSQNFNVSQET